MPSWELCQIDGALVLQPLSGLAQGVVRVDFVTGRTAYRIRRGGGRKGELARAIGIPRANRGLRVLDLTAGLGRDTFLLASWGCAVLALERHPMIHALLADGLRRAWADPETAALLDDDPQRLQLLEADAREYLKTIAPSDFDVLYLDPMHPSRQKSAKVRKEMQAFQEVVGSDSDDAELLAVARASGVARVVVKRPVKSDLLAPGVAFSQKGKTVRYDVYLLPRVGETESLD
ncbi:MAG: class I SAM-dependent methyltransferase [Planctomycetes bacterium]|nr:class I SAM-dependent methyltransferase [Planctomycetota bacterium]MBT5101762.1 class I SAM-dependent methyltransferase [Planctomycetota bacterium]MBT7318857.1 class I SAM-dependent methyltransferase [Planctomycetota bacterium]